mgnify:CR=1 FL=1
MRVGVHLCAGVGRSWLLRLPSRRAEVLLRAALCCAKKGLHGIAALLLTAESGLRVGLGPCVPGARGRLHCVCGRGQCSRVCKVLVAAEAGSVRKDGGTALVPAAVADQETARLLPAHRRPLLEGRRHRGTDPPASLRRSRHPERHRCSAYRAILEALPWSRCCVPMKKSCN